MIISYYIILYMIRIIFLLYYNQYYIVDSGRSRRRGKPSRGTRRRPGYNIYIYIYIHVYIHTHNIYIYIYIYMVAGQTTTDRSRETERAEIRRRSLLPAR